jgi:hypothetical protein
MFDPGRVDRHLFAEDVDAGRRRGELGPAQICVVEAEVVIILRPVSGSSGKKLDEARETCLLVPLLSQLGQGFGRRGRRMVVVDDIAGSDEEIGSELVHRFVRRIAEPAVLLRGTRAAAVLAVHEERIVLAAPHAERERASVARGRECLELPCRA